MTSDDQPGSIALRSRGDTHLIIDQHQIERKHPNNDLNILYLHVFLRPIRKILERPERSRILIERNDLCVHNEGCDLLGCEEIKHALAWDREIGCGWEGIRDVGRRPVDHDVDEG